MTLYKATEAKNQGKFTEERNLLFSKELQLLAKTLLSFQF